MRVSRSLMIVAACESSLQQCFVGSCGQAPELLMLVQLGALQCNSIEMFLREYMLCFQAQRVQSWPIS